MPTAALRMTLSLESRRVLQLVVPVETHVLDDAIAHHDDARLFVGEALMIREWRNVDVVALLPFEPLRFLRPFPYEFVLAVEHHVPMQVVTGAFHHEGELFPHVAMLARALAGLEEQHIGLDAKLGRLHVAMDEVLDQAVGRTFPRHVLGLHHVRAARIVLAEFLRLYDLLGAPGAALVPRKGSLLVLNRAHPNLPDSKVPSAANTVRVRDRDQAAIPPSSATGDA